MKPMVSIRCLCLAVLGSLLGGGTLRSEEEEKEKDPLKGRARWEWSFTTSDGKTEKGTFLSFPGGQLANPKDRALLGHWKATGPGEIKVLITKGNLAGTADLKMTKEQPPTWEGSLVHSSGK